MFKNLCSDAYIDVVQFQAEASMSVVVPIVHLNGTSRERLLEQRDVAFVALDAAYGALRQMAPNGRDYYPQPGLMEKAVEQHSRRLNAIKSVMESIQAEVDALFFADDE